MMYNPQLNSQRSATRVIDENVPTALAGYRPRVLEVTLRQTRDRFTAGEVTRTEVAALRAFGR